MKRLNTAVMATCILLTSSANAAAPECFAKIAQVATEKMGADARRLFMREVNTADLSISQRQPNEFEVSATLISRDGHITAEGSRIVADIIRVTIERPCEVRAVARDKEKTFVGCYGGCNNAPPSDENAYNELYRRQDL